MRRLTYSHVPQSFAFCCAAFFEQTLTGQRDLLIIGISCNDKIVQEDFSSFYHSTLYKHKIQSMWNGMYIKWPMNIYFPVLINNRELVYWSSAPSTVNTHSKSSSTHWQPLCGQWWNRKSADFETVPFCMYVAHVCTQALTSKLPSSFQKQQLVKAVLLLLYYVLVFIWVNREINMTFMKSHFSFLFF